MAARLRDNVETVMKTYFHMFPEKKTSTINILNNFKILVIKRNTDDLESILKKLAKYKDNIIVTDIEKSSLSSTQIRENFTIQDMSVYLNENVLKYIKDNDLYR